MRIAPNPNQPARPPRPPSPPPRHDGLKMGGALVGSAVAMGLAGADQWHQIHGLPSVDDLPMDKLAHAQGSCILTVAAHLGVGLPPWLAAVSAFTVVSLGKEVVYDWLLGHGTPDLHDVVANASGALAGYTLAKAAERRAHPTL